MGNLSGREDTFMLTTELFIVIIGICLTCLSIGFSLGYAIGKISNKNYTTSICFFTMYLILYISQPHQMAYQTPH